MIRSPRIGQIILLSAILMILLVSMLGSAGPSVVEAASDGKRQGGTGPDATATLRAKRAGEKRQYNAFRATASAMIDGSDETATFGPEEGTLIVGSKNNNFACADVSLANFGMTIRMINPRSPGSNRWQYYIQFRLDSDDHYFLIIDSLAGSGLAFNEAGNNGLSNIRLASVVNFDRSRKGFNDFVMLVQDNLALVVVNGEYLTPFKINRKAAAGDVCIGLFTDATDGMEVDYERWEIYELQ